MIEETSQSCPIYLNGKNGTKMIQNSPEVRAWLRTVDTDKIQVCFLVDTLLFIVQYLVNFVTAGTDHGVIGQTDSIGFLIQFILKITRSHNFRSRSSDAKWLSCKQNSRQCFSKYLGREGLANLRIRAHGNHWQQFGCMYQL